MKYHSFQDVMVYDFPISPIAWYGNKFNPNVCSVLITFQKRAILFKKSGVLVTL